MADETQYKYLAPRYGSSYRQYFLKGSKIRAERCLLKQLVPKLELQRKVAEDYEMPVEAV